jgi:DNA-binding protein YbaB
MEFDMNKMQQMLSQAEEMQQTMDLRLAETIVEADTGGGAVKARMNGKKELLSVTLTLLEDLIVAAVNAAGRKADEASKSNTASMLGGLGLPGF